VIKHLAGTLYVTRAGGFNGGYTEDGVLKPLAMIAREENVNAVIVESNFGDGLWSQLFKPILHAVHPCSMEEVRHHTNKEMRICDTLEPLMARHKLVVTPSVIEEDYRTSYGVKDANGKTKSAYSLFYQMTRMMREKGALYHDDRLDALAIGVAFFTERLARDANKEIADMKQGKLDAWMKKRYDNRASKKTSEVGVSGLYAGRNSSGFSENQRMM